MIRVLGYKAHTLHRIIFMVGCVLLMMAYPYISALSFEMQVLLLGIFVVLLGMPHGALDPLLAQMFGADMSNPAKHAGFYGLYMGIAAGSLLIWFVWPVYALLAFLIISIVHFSADWEDDIPTWLQLFAGTALITHPCYFFPDQVETIFSFLTFGSDTGWIVDLFRILEIPVCIILYIGIIGCYLRDPKHGPAFVETVILHFLASLFAPLVYFVLYFCGLHSVRHYIDSVGELKAAGFSTNKIITMIEFITVLTAGLMGIAFFFMGDLAVEESVIRIVFISLFALTVPHMFLLGWIKLTNYRLR